VVAIMDGIRVVEVASWTFVPVAGGVLAEWGADVLKIEHPTTGDPQRGLVSSGLVPAGGVAHMVELPNRGKRSVALDLKSEEGHELLMQLVATADVFLTNFLPAARASLHIDVDDVRAVNPRIIYVRGSANGQRGAEANRGGYDNCTFWARSGAADTVSPDELGYPVTQPGAAFGDTLGGLTLAGGIAAALLHRERTGEALEVDLSLLALGAWAMGASIAGCAAFGLERVPRHPPSKVPNPLVNTYETADGRFLSLVMLESDRFWPELVTALGRPDLAQDERFCDHGRRMQHNEACIAELAAAFCTRTLAEWRAALADIKGVWSAVQWPSEVVDDPQVVANDLVAELQDHNGTPFKLVAGPLQFDGAPGDVRRAPEHGEHTDAVLAELGLEMDSIIELKIKGAVL
jgi:crotonobetainyl-CoA:carnitine CoA-transferase CaiB-like acyl-CoA transferase